MKDEKNTEFDRFQGALRTVLSVSHQELQRRLKEEKQEHAAKPKRGPKPREKTPTASQ